MSVDMAKDVRQLAMKNSQGVQISYFKSQMIKGNCNQVSIYVRTPRQKSVALPFASYLFRDLQSSPCTHTIKEAHEQMETGKTRGRVKQIFLLSQFSYPGILFLFQYYKRNGLYFFKTHVLWSDIHGLCSALRKVKRKYSSMSSISTSSMRPPLIISIFPGP